MPGDVFVDTSGFFALIVARDLHHARCAELVGDLARRRGLAFTSEAIISETCTLLQARRQGHLIGEFLNYVDAARALTVLPTGGELFQRTKEYLHALRARVFVCELLQLSADGGPPPHPRTLNRRALPHRRSQSIAVLSIGDDGREFFRCEFRLAAC